MELPVQPGSVESDLVCCCLAGTNICSLVEMYRYGKAVGHQAWTIHVPSFHVVGGSEQKGRGGPPSAECWFAGSLGSTRAPSFHLLLYVGQP